MRRTLLTSLLILTALTALTACTSRLIYAGAGDPALRDCPRADASPGARAVSYRMADGTRLHGWLWNRGRNASLVIAYGGNAMNVGDFADLAARDPRRSYLLVNYRGYGKSEGRPSEAHAVADARAVLQQVRRELRHRGRVALLGYSLGSSIATQVAAAEGVDALILACPFDNLLAVSCHHLPLLPRLLLREHYHSDEAAPQVRCPVTLFVGEQDSVVPPAHSLRLTRCFTQAPVSVHRYPCGHNDIFSQDALYPALDAALHAMDNRAAPN